MDSQTYFKQAEKNHRSFLPDSRFLVLRLDGKAFHSYTKGLERPYDALLMSAMDSTTTALCKEIPSIIVAYTQSDEISLVLDLKPSDVSEPWLGGSVQKIVSITASMATAHFNSIRISQGFTKLAYFDSRIMTFDDIQDVLTYCHWRRRDAIKNSVSMAAHAHFGHKALAGKNTTDRKEMLADAGMSWDDLPEGFKFGRYTFKEYRKEVVEFVRKKTKETQTTWATRTHWLTKDASNVLTAEMLQAK